MPTDTQVNDLKINVLSEAQYEQIQSPSSTELYLVPDVVDTTPTSGSTNPITSGGVYSALQNIPEQEQSDWNETDTTNPAYIKHKPTIPTNAADVSALPSSTKYAASLYLSVNSSTYVVTAQLKDQDGNNIGAAQTIDLPLESVVVSGSYNAQTKKVVLTLQNGSTIEFSVADLVAGLQSEITAQNPLSADLVVDGNVNKVFTLTMKTKLDGIEAGAEVNVQSDWNQTDNTQDDYIKNKPTIPTVPTNVSAFTNDAGYLTQEADPTVPSWAKAASKPAYDYSEINNTPTIPSAPGTLTTNATASQTASAGEAMSGNITLHKVSKTGSYNDLNDKLKGGNYIEIVNGVQGYTTIESVYNTATDGRLNTGIKPTVDNIEIEITFMLKSNNAFTTIFTSCGSSSTRNGLIQISSKELSWYYNNRVVAYISTPLINGKKYYAKVKAKEGSVTLYLKNIDDNIEYSETATYTPNSTVYPANFYLYGAPYASTNAQGYNYVYELRMKSDNVMVLDYVPVTKDENNETTVGFYDRVTESLVTGSKIAASDKVVSYDYININGLPYEPKLPPKTGNSGKVLAVNSNADGVEWVKPVVIYDGNTTPSSSLGSDGDIYIQTAS